MRPVEAPLSFIGSGASLVVLEDFMGIPIFYDRPFLTYEEQIEHLRTKHNLLISDEQFAKDILSNISYYDLVNGYKDSLMNNDKFKPGTSIEFLYLFYLFDKNFQNIIFKNSLIVENSFKNKLAYMLADKISEHQDYYLSSKYYVPAVNKYIVFHKVKDEIFTNIRYYDNQSNTYIYNKQPTKHYFENHNHIPPWILMKNISFGNAINLYRLLNKHLKENFTDSIITSNINVNDKISFYTSALNLIREFRNVIAHNLKFVTFQQNRFRLPHKTTIKILNNSTLTDNVNMFNNLYACILAIYLLLDLPILRYNFLTDIYKLMSENPLKSTPGKLITAHMCNEYFKITDLAQNLEFIDKMNILFQESKNIKL
jgi:abortive infection bacteriophage resistance protein